MNAVLWFESCVLCSISFLLLFHDVSQIWLSCLTLHRGRGHLWCWGRGHLWGRGRGQLDMKSRSYLNCWHNQSWRDRLWGEIITVDSRTTTLITYLFRDWLRERKPLFNILAFRGLPVLLANTLLLTSLPSRSWRTLPNRSFLSWTRLFRIKHFLRPVVRVRSFQRLQVRSARIAVKWLYPPAINARDLMNIHLELWLNLKHGRTISR